MTESNECTGAHWDIRPSEPKIVFLFRGVELVPDPRAHYAAWVGPVWITLWRQENEAGCTWHHAAATLIDSDTCGRAHVQVKDEDPSKALEKLDRLVDRFSEWGGADHAAHCAQFSNARNSWPTGAPR